MSGESMSEKLKTYKEAVSIKTPIQFVKNLDSFNNNFKRCYLFVRHNTKRIETRKKSCQNCRFFSNKGVRIHRKPLAESRFRPSGEFCRMISTKKPYNLFNFIRIF